MLHFSYKHLLAVKVHRKYFFSIVDLDLSYSEVGLLEKLKPSETYTIIEVIKFCHVVEVASNKEV